MIDMQFLKENKALLYIAITLPLFFFALDNTFILWLRDLEKSRSSLYVFLESVDPLINLFSHGVTLIIIASLMCVIGKFSNKKLYEAGKSLCIGFLTAGVVTQILKHLIGRARPRMTDELLLIGPTLKSGYDSFPSGHTAVAFCFAYILSQYFPRYRIIFYIFAIFCGFERAEDSAHFLSDVLAGAFVGLLIGKILLKMFHVKFTRLDTTSNNNQYLIKHS
jgi:membrane-associated phospholipid phosphatase